MAWTITKFTDQNWTVSSGAVETEDGIPIANMHREAGNGVLPTERDAHAYFIAAAPAMYRALLEALPKLPAGSVANRVRDAIAQAETYLTKFPEAANRKPKVTK